MEKFERWTKIIIWKWTNGPIFLPWTIHLMGEFERLTKNIILRWTSWRIFDDWPSTPWTNSGDKFHQMDGGGRADERSTNYFPWRLYSINGWGLGKFEIRVEGEF